MRTWVFALSTIVACASNAPLHVATPAPLPGTDGASHSILPTAPDAYTVVIFFSSGCHVLAAHDERVRNVAKSFAHRGVRFLGVDSEVDATLDRDRADIERRHYPFPVVLDRGGELARTLGGEFAGYTVILDREGNVRYRGGIDSDRVRLRDDATPYLSQALDDLLAGKTPRVPESKALGCALKLR